MARAAAAALTLVLVLVLARGSAVAGMGLQEELLDGDGAAAAAHPGYGAAHTAYGVNNPPEFITADEAVADGFRQVLRDETQARLEELGKISDDDHSLSRNFLSPAHVRAADMIEAWMQDAGMRTWVDAIGNMHGRIDVANSSAPALLIGSHFDTVLDAGQYDGPLGIMTAIAAVKALLMRFKQEELHKPIEVIAFSDEEGIRFQSTFLGSRAVAGTFQQATVQSKDSSGDTLVEVLAAAGYNSSWEAIRAAAYDKATVDGYVEVHIEQGPVLESLDVPTGAVVGIAAQVRLQATVTGVQGHAGTVPMHQRRDALTGVAEAITAVEKLCGGGRTTSMNDEWLKTARSANLVCTVGSITVWPGASNVIPSKVTFTLDIRALDDNICDEAVVDAAAAVQTVCHRRGLKLDMQKKHTQPAVPCSERLTQSLREAAVQGNSAAMNSVTLADPPLLTSGAGHDAMAMADLTEVAMLFVRCKGGVSHAPEEHVDADDILAASTTLLLFLQEEVVRKA